MSEARWRGGALPALVLGLCLLPACGPERDDAGEPCAGAQQPAIEAPAIDLDDPAVSRHNLRAWVELLTSPQLRGRHAGEDGARQAAALVATEMSRVGLVPASSADAPTVSTGGGYCRAFPFLDAEDYNVAGALPPASESTAPADAPVMVVSAHYDGQGMHPAGMIYPGADDNASGVAALLEVARLAARRSPRIGWEFVAFGAEEGGQQGARAYLSASTPALARIELAVNLDMVGRPFPGPHADAIGYLAFGGSAPAAQTRLQAAAADSGLEIRSLERSGGWMPTISDAAVLGTRLPTLLLSTALHEDHHQPTDTPEKIDYVQIERAVRLVLALGNLGRSTELEPGVGDILPAF